MQKGHISLHYAALSGHVEMVKALVCEFGANLNAKGEDGLTPLQLAKQRGRDLITNE